MESQMIKHNIKGVYQLIERSWC